MGSSKTIAAGSAMQKLQFKVSHLPKGMYYYQMLCDHHKKGGGFMVQ